MKLYFRVFDETQYRLNNGTALPVNPYQEGTQFHHEFAQGRALGEADWSRYSASTRRSRLEQIRKDNPKAVVEGWNA